MAFVERPIFTLIIVSGMKEPIPFGYYELHYPYTSNASTKMKRYFTGGTRLLHGDIFGQARVEFLFVLLRSAKF